MNKRSITVKGKVWEVWAYLSEAGRTVRRDDPEATHYWLKDPTTRKRGPAIRLDEATEDDHLKTVRAGESAGRAWKAAGAYREALQAKIEAKAKHREAVEEFHQGHQGQEAGARKAIEAERALGLARVEESCLGTIAVSLGLIAQEDAAVAYRGTDEVYEVSREITTKLVEAGAPLPEAAAWAKRAQGG